MHILSSTHPVSLLLDPLLLQYALGLLVHLQQGEGRGLS